MRIRTLLPWMVVVLHTILVIMVAWQVTVALKSSSEVIALWTIFMIVDFPIGWLMGPIEGMLGSFISDTFGSMGRWVGLFAVGYGILGGIQWYLIALIIVRWRYSVGPKPNMAMDDNERGGAAEDE